MPSAISLLTAHATCTIALGVLCIYYPAWLINSSIVLVLGDALQLVSLFIHISHAKFLKYKVKDTTQLGLAGVLLLILGLINLTMVLSDDKRLLRTQCKYAVAQCLHRHSLTNSTYPHSNGLLTHCMDLLVSYAFSRQQPRVHSTLHGPLMAGMDLHKLGRSPTCCIQRSRIV